MKTHVLGFPRMGVQRELKFALESYWKGNSTLDELQKISRELRLNHWKVQKNAGLSFVSTGDFSWYDHVLDTAVLLGVIPKRFRDLPSGSAELYFAMARGDQKKNIPAMEMTKWFDTNYHYIVPEIDTDCSPCLCSSKIFDETREAVEAGFEVKPTLLGPISFLALAKNDDDFDRWHLLPRLLAVYKEILTKLSAYGQWIQLDEPILCSDMSEKERNRFTTAYQFLNSIPINVKLLLTTYYDGLDDHLDLALDSGCAGLHLDLVRGGMNLDDILNRFPEKMILSAGIVEGRNIWRNDYAASLEILNKIKAKLGMDRMMIASSCSLLHCPETLEFETKMDSEIKSWLAFASEKCEEITELKTIVTEGTPCEAEQNNQFVIESRRQSRRVHSESVQKRCSEITEEMKHRQHSYNLRKESQRWLSLPLFPTTTIGSYPQTDEIRRYRNDFVHGRITEETYNSFIENEIAKVIRKQEEIGLDVFVHGEPERNDMVKYFGDQLNGFCVTQNGWV